MFFIKTLTVCQRLGCEKFGLRSGKHKKCRGKGCDSTRMQTARRFSPARFAVFAVVVSLFIFIQQNNGWPLVLQKAVGFTASAISEVQRLLLSEDSNAARKAVYYPAIDTTPAAVAYTPQPTPVPYRDPAIAIVSAAPRSGDSIQQSDPQWIKVSLSEDAAVNSTPTAPAAYEPVTGWAVSEKRPLLPNRLAIGDVLVAGTVCYDEGQSGEMTIVFNASSNPVPVHAPWGAGEVTLPEDPNAAWLTIDSIINDALTIRPDIFRVRLVTICPCGLIKTTYFQ